jgi:hypothetical protein
MDQFSQQRNNRSNTNNPKEKDSIFYSFTPLAAVGALLRKCVRGRRAWYVLPGNQSEADERVWPGGGGKARGLYESRAKVG